MSNFDRDTWRTPDWMFYWLDSIYGFNLDIAASDDFHWCDKYFTKERSALTAPWGDSSTVAFCNPPYSRGMKEAFVQKALEQRTKGVTTVMLIPALPSEGWFPYDSANHIMFVVDGRVNFINPVTETEIKGVPAGSCICVFDAKSLSTRTNITFVQRDIIRAAGESIMNQMFFGEAA